MPKLFSSPDSQEIDLHTLVLSASRIPFAVVHTGSQWEIWVKETHLEAARHTLAAYAAENPGTPLGAFPHTGADRITPSGLWVAGLLFVIHVAVVYHHALEKMVQVYGADADLIMKGQLYRVVTALFLHAGPLHLAGNMVAIILFGTAVCTVTGVAVGWLMILLAASLGNLLNAVFYQTAHLSIGASTAVFSAIGILAGVRFVRKTAGEGWKRSPWLPLAAGLALLGMLGSGGAHTDLMAHLFGMLSGGAMGMGFARWLRPPLPEKYETWSWLLISVILMAAFGAGALP
jgi:membrane associated rhomboid family serine protease